MLGLSARPARHVAPGEAVKPSKRDLERWVAQAAAVVKVIEKHFGKIELVGVGPKHRTAPRGTPPLRADQQENLHE